MTDKPDRLDAKLLEILVCPLTKGRNQKASAISTFRTGDSGIIVAEFIVSSFGHLMLALSSSCRQAVRHYTERLPEPKIEEASCIVKIRHPSVPARIAAELNRPRGGTHE